ncbi:MAG: nitrogen regulation protein NR(II) [Halobacteriales archaeon]
MVGIRGTIQDITERKEREQELREIKERFQAVFQQSNDAIIIVDADDGEFVEANEAACEMLGYSREELLALHPEDIHPDDIDHERKEFVEAVHETGSGWTDELACVTKGGEEIPTEISGAALRTDAGREQPSKMVAILRDVSDRVAYERKLERQNERLENFASVVSHDLRNPLSLAEGYLKILRETGDEDVLGEMEAAHERMRTIINDVLTVARDGQAVEDVEPVDVRELVEAAWAGVETGDATIRIEGTPGEAMGDEDRLRRVFENLFRNAIDHAGADVTVTIGCLPDGDGIYVADDGPGIPASEREDVFEWGYSTADDGTGYGLAIVNDLVEAHGWTVTTAESDAGGARFEIAGIDPAGVVPDRNPVSQ